MNNNTGNLIRDERRKQKLTLRDLAQKTGIDYSMISKYENGIVTPPESKLRIIMETLNLSEDAFISSEQAYEMDTFVRRRSVVTEVDEDRYVVSQSNVAKEVLKIADGRCELCGQSFSDGENYLEIHHVIWLSDGGTPTLDNTVALCPNCHKRIHLYRKEADIIKLYEVAKTHKSNDDDQ